MVGSEANAEVQRYMGEVMQHAGFEVTQYPYDLYLPNKPGSSLIEIVTPSRAVLNQKEDIIPGDSFSEDPELWKGWNAFSGSGDVTAEVVYANYGRKEDFEMLQELGVDVKGKIVLARYGGNFRGFKAKFAEANAVANFTSIALVLLRAFPGLVLWHSYPALDMARHMGPRPFDINACFSRINDAISCAVSDATLQRAFLRLRFVDLRPLQQSRLHEYADFIHHPGEISERIVRVLVAEQAAARRKLFTVTRTPSLLTPALDHPAYALDAAPARSVPGR